LIVVGERCHAVRACSGTVRLGGESGREGRSGGTEASRLLSSSPGAGLAGSTLGALGFGLSGESAGGFPSDRSSFAATTETRNTPALTARSPAGIIIHKPWRPRQERQVRHHSYRGRSGSSGEIAARSVRKGRRCSTSSHAPTRLKAPMYRAPGSNQFKQVSWDFALDRIATLMKQDRDANLHRPERPRNHGQPLGSAPACWRPPRRPARPRS